MKLPINIRKYFWDIDPTKAQVNRYPHYYIDRILELGDTKSVKWLVKTFGLPRIKKTLRSSKISEKSLNYWKLIFP